jgi:valyl-tRNA synthetase
MEELAKSYNPKETEGQIYDLWENLEAFKPVIDKSQKPFVITIPPPNVTGFLHMGHALNSTIQDILIRRSRMKGVPTLWVPGTDHAAIAIQNVIEKQLVKEGINRQEIGREEFIRRVWAWIDEYGDRIVGQLKSLGCSCDWSCQRFTMDDDYTEAVNTAFKHYLDKGWIYQGERVINWCTRCQTSLSDLEVEHLDQKAKLYFFKYDKNFPITIATTRPETKFGDVAVAVNPKDKRYEKYIGQTFKVDFAGVEREIKVIGDPSVDMEFGTGAVGVTPAHSLVDAEMAQKHGLDVIKIIDQYGRMTPEVGLEYEGMKVAEVQEKLIERLKNEGLMEKEEEIDNALSVCYRCNRPIEPQPSKQWFLKMGELAKPAIEAVEKGEIEFVPERWEKVYLEWMYNLKDWCISRQLWFGHKIPIEGEEDVLDTWFSSALWPFATLGWPARHASLQGVAGRPKEDNLPGTPEDLAYFYPTTVLSTARDIIYLWVARMIFSGYEFMGEKPFSKVYIHPTIFNKEGKRMSKSLGTGVDPLELIDKYGADATRFGLTYINTGIQDLKFDEEAIKAGQKFANKIWNIARFIMMQEGEKTGEIKPKTEADKKILNKLAAIIASTDKNLDNFRFGQFAHDLYDFVWHDFADTYIEESKKDLNAPLLLHVLTSTLKLLHPMMPYVTEKIWQNLYENKLVDEQYLILAKWPGESIKS